MNECAFCHDGPVYNAGAWLAPAQPIYAHCPRCGQLHIPPREPEQPHTWEAR